MVSVKVFIFAFILMIIAIAYPLISLKNKTMAKTGGKPSISDKADDSYFKTIDPWNDSKNIPYKFNGVSVPNTDQCNVYTYENLYSGTEFNSPLDIVSNGIKPNLETVFDDYINGLNHAESSDYKLNCIGPDQIQANFISKKCKSKIGTSPSNLICYNPLGQKINPGKISEYPVNCGTSICGGQLGTFSFNIKIDENNFINNSTKCLSLKKLRVSEKDRTKYQSIFNFYESLGVVEYDSSIGTCGKFYPEFENADCNTYDPRQKFLINRYTADEDKKADLIKKKEGVSIPEIMVKTGKGSYTEIIFRPADAYLDYIFEGTSGIQTLLISDPGVCFVNISSETIVSNPDGVSARCYPITDNDNKIINLSFVTRGEGFVSGQTYSVINNGESPKKKNAEIIVKTVFNTNPTFVFIPKEDKTLEDSIRWFLADPVDTTKRVTSSQICDKLTLNVQSITNKIGRRRIKENYYVPVSGQFNQGDELLPINYDIKNMGNQWGKKGLCDKILQNYPDKSLISLTSGTEINPYDLINYNIKPSFYNSNFGSDAEDTVFKIPLYPIISNKNTGEIANLSKGSKFVNNQTTFVVSDPTIDVFGFDPLYFNSSGNLVISVSDPNPSTAPGYEITLNSNSNFKVSDTGLLTTQIIAFKDTINDQSRKEGIYIVDQTSTSRNGADATFEVTVREEMVSGLTKNKLVNKVVKVTVVSPGKNYSQGDEITINDNQIGSENSGTNLTINVSSDTINEETIMVSFPGDDNGTPIYPPNNLTGKNIVTSNFSMRGTIISSNSNLYFKRSNSEAGYIVSGGLGSFKLGQKIYLYPQNLTEEEISNLDPFKNTQLFVTVNQLSDKTYQRNLESPINLQNIERNKIVSSLDFLEPNSFNFMENSSMELEPSPPQIIYLGESLQGTTLLEEFAISNTINSSDDIRTYMVTKKSNGINTDINYLKTLQFENLNYRSYKEKKDVINSISNNEQLVLGRFVPYMSFTPVYRRFKEKIKYLVLPIFGIPIPIPYVSRPATINPVTGKKDTETDEGSIVYGVSNKQFNANYTQFIPYGIDNFYFTQVPKDTLGKF